MLTLAALPACRSEAAEQGVPALLTHPTAASRADLSRAVARAFGGAPVRLAPDALTRDSLLVVGRAQARDARGLPLDGRQRGRPQHFRLLRRGTQCVLLHVESGRWYLLRHATCRAAPTGSGRG